MKVPWNKGISLPPFTDEHRAKISMALKGKNKTLEHRANVGKVLKGRIITSEWKDKISKALKGRVPWNKGIPASPEYKAKVSEAVRRAFATTNLKEKISLALRGKRKSKEHAAKLSRNLLKGWSGFRHSEDRKRKVAEESMKRWANPEFKKKMLSILQSDEYRTKMRQALLEKWEQDRDYVKNVFSGRKVKPNRLEIKVRELLSGLFPDEFKYVGDGEVVIGRRCPDFINVNGKKQIIEVFGKYWHPDPNEEKGLREHYGKYGYSTLIIWEDEINDLSKLEEKLIAFTKEDSRGLNFGNLERVKMGQEIH